MNHAVRLDSDEVKEIIAEHFHIDVSQVIKSKYSYFLNDVELEDIEEKQDKQFR